MSKRQWGGLGCLLLGIAFAGVAIKNSFVTPIVPIDDPSGLGVSRTVGAFLPAIAALTIGIWLLRRPKQ